MKKTKKSVKPVSSTSVEYVVSYTDSVGKASNITSPTRDAMREILRALKPTGVRYTTSRVTTVRTAQNIS